ncbi:MAG: 7-cyano-7-deazaguanine synthase [Elusimicrobia bacterium]|nr:7-cyano-7-deazaguanine synthase [Elusimicrobiota bacterium]
MEEARAARAGTAGTQTTAASPSSDREAPDGSFFAAWSLAGDRVASLLSEEARRRVLERLNLSQQEREERLEGPLWLAAGRSRTARHQDRVCAYEGLLHDDAAGLETVRKLATAHAPPGADALRYDGQYVLLLAEAKAGRLFAVRDPGGRQPLYYARIGELLLLAPSIRLLLATGMIERRFDEEAAAQCLLAGRVALGNATLFSGIQELLAGHLLTADRGELRQVWHWGDLLSAPDGDPRDLARSLRGKLRSAVQRCLGRDREAAVALSGGIDSAAVAATAAEMVGPRNVTAFTFEFDQAGNPSETPFASRVCRALGLRHEIVRFSERDVVDLLPSFWWASEPVLRWGSYAHLLFPHQLGRLGVRKHLSGLGFGGNAGYLEELAAWVPALPFRERLLRCWKTAFRLRPPWGRGAAIDPWRLSPPSYLCFPVLCLLKDRGLVRDVSAFFPAGIEALVHATERSERVQGALGELSGLPLASALQRLCFTHLLNYNHTGTRLPLARATGTEGLSPALFPECLPLGALPLRERFPLWDSRRRLRPGKQLLRLAFQGVLPNEILRRPKVGYIPAPESWQRECGRLAQAVAGQAPLPIAAAWSGRVDWSALAEGERRLRLLGLIHLGHGDRREAPGWDDLGLPA